MPASTLTAMQVLSHLYLSAAPGGKDYYDYSIDRKIRLREGERFTKDTEALNGKARI
jgi:hypothetical protein